MTKQTLEEKDIIVKIIGLCSDGKVDITPDKYSSIEQLLQSELKANDNVWREKIEKLRDKKWDKKILKIIGEDEVITNYMDIANGYVRNDVDGEIRNMFRHELKTKFKILKRIF